MIIIIATAMHSQQGEWECGTAMHSQQGIATAMHSQQGEWECGNRWQGRTKPQKFKKHCSR